MVRGGGAGRPLVTATRSDAARRESDLGIAFALTVRSDGENGALGRLDALEAEAEWGAALAHAGLSQDDCIVLFTDRAPTDTGRGAQWWEPGMRIEVDQDFVSDELAAELNSHQNLHRHRVIVRRPQGRDSFSMARLSGKLRHELEHARQWEACGPPPFQLSEVADAVLKRKLVGLPSGRVFTNLKPIEQDANAASAVFLRARWPQEVPRLLEDPEDGPLARSLTPPGRLETLVKRMVAFLFLYEDLCAELGANWPTGFGYVLEKEIAPRCAGLLGDAPNGEGRARWVHKRSRLCRLRDLRPGTRF